MDSTKLAGGCRKKERKEGRKNLIGLLGMALLLFSFTTGIIKPNAAWADYVCDVRLEPTSTTWYGSYGNLRVELWNGPNCTGSQVMWGRALSTSATAYSSAYQYNSTQLMQLYQALLEAGKDGTNVNAAYVTNPADGYKYFQAISFKFNN